MDRRQFCKISALAFGAICIGAFDAHPTNKVDSEKSVIISRPCRISVVKRECFVDIQSLYLDDPESGPCRVFDGRMSWDISQGAACPDGFCRKAWAAIASYVNSESRCSDTRPGVLFVACPDGSRPVIFKVELQSLA